MAQTQICRRWLSSSAPAWRAVAASIGPETADAVSKIAVPKLKSREIKVDLVIMA
jgi:hypothetical protein